MSRPRTRARRLRAAVLSTALAAAALALGLASALARGEPTLADLRRRLLEAHTPDERARALDALQARVGRADGFTDVGAFGDWLGALPDGRHRDPTVLVRRGWAYVTARRGAEAIEPLQAALRDDPSQGLVRAYLGEALRQAGAVGPALEMLGTAGKAGHDTPFLREAALASVLALRIAEPVRAAPSLPAYAASGALYLLHVRDGRVHGALAQALLEDLAASERPDTARGQVWAVTAGEHLLAALQLGAALEQPARLALEAARALTVADGGKPGRTPRVELLEAAYRLGRPADREGHDLPEALPLLAEAALHEGRYELAHRLCRERLALSESPAARRVLALLPPDVGD